MRSACMGLGKVFGGLWAALSFNLTVVDPIALQARNVVRNSVER